MTEEETSKKLSELYNLANAVWKEIKKDYKDASLDISIKPEDGLLRMNFSVTSENLIQSGYIADRLFNIQNDQIQSS